MIKCGSKTRVVMMDPADGMDWQAKRPEGKVFTVRFIDSAGKSTSKKPASHLFRVSMNMSL